MVARPHLWWGPGALCDLRLLVTGRILDELRRVAGDLHADHGGGGRRSPSGPRVTPHVRHREKYVDVPVREDHAFAFPASNGQREVRTRTLREFVDALETMPPAALDAYLRRGDFSRWIADVFGDRALAAELRALEAPHRTVRRADTICAMADVIRGRYDLLDEDAAVNVSVAAPS